MNYAELPNLAASILQKCADAELNYSETMAFLVQVAEMAAHMHQNISKESQEDAFIHACNVAIKELKNNESVENKHTDKFIHSAPERKM